MNFHNRTILKQQQIANCKSAKQQTAKQQTTQQHNNTTMQNCYLYYLSIIKIQSNPNIQLKTKIKSIKQIIQI